MTKIRGLQDLTLGTDDWTDMTRTSLLTALRKITTLPLDVPDEGHFEHIGAFVFAGEAGSDFRLRSVVAEAVSGISNESARAFSEAEVDHDYDPLYAAAKGAASQLLDFLRERWWDEWTERRRMRSWERLVKYREL